MKSVKLFFSLFLLLCFSSIVLGVSVDPSVDFSVDVFTLNTLSVQNFSYIHIDDSYMLLQWSNSSVIYNISFITNYNYTVFNDSIVWEYDFYSPGSWSFYSTYIDIYKGGVKVDSVIPTVYQISDSLKHAYYKYNLEDNSNVYVGIYIYSMNDTIRYEGYKIYNEIGVSYMDFYYFVMMFVILGFFYVVAEWKRDIVMYMLTAVLSLVFAVSSFSFGFNSLVSVAMFLFAIYNSFLALGYTMANRGARKL